MNRTLWKILMKTLVYNRYPITSTAMTRKSNGNNDDNDHMDFVNNDDNGRENR